MNVPGTTSPPTGGAAARDLSPRALLRRHGPALVAAAAGLAWFGVHVGFSVVDPRHVAWLHRDDWAQSYLGWTFFRTAPWGWPLGASPAYPFPVGSTVAYSDSLPILAVLLRPLSPLLPFDFQYVGAWLALSFALQGFAGAKLVALATPSRVQQALGGALFALAPPLLHRVVGPYTGHGSLCGQWLVLAFLWIALAPRTNGRDARRTAVGAAALLLLATGLHPYLVVMGVALSMAFAVRLWLVDRLVPAPAALGGLAAAPVLALAGLLAFGYLGVGASTAAQGFGYFSADAFALLNPMGWSRAWDGFPIGRGQYEGFGYLGGGVLLLGALAAALAIARRGVPADGLWTRALPALVVAVLLATFALSDQVTAWGHRVLDARALYAAVPALGSTLRSSGRFVWPLHDLALAAAVFAVVIALRDRPRVATAALAAALAVQALDVRPPVPARFASASWTSPVTADWLLARGAYRHVVLHPPYLLDGSGPVAPEACGLPLYPPGGYVLVADLAARVGATFNSAYLARIDQARAAAACRDDRERIARGDLDPETIYVVHGSQVITLAGSGAICGLAGQIPACVRGDRTDPFAAGLRARPLVR